MTANARSVVTRRAALARMVAAASTVMTRPAAATIMDFVVIGKDDWLFAIYDEVRRTDLLRIKTVTQIINEAVGVLKHAGIETAICLTPAKSRIYRDYLPADFQFNADSDRRYALSLDMLRDAGTLVPDLSTTLLEQRKSYPGDPVFLKADTHWTGSGAEPVAVGMAKQIKARMHLPTSDKPGTQLGPLVVVKQGNNDLAEGLPDAMEAKYGPQSYKVHQVAQSAGSMLEDDAADVLLVGNSFMQPKYGFAPMLSNQLERPVSLAWKVHQSSPYKTLLGALGAYRLRKQKPKLLVWDFEETDMMATADQAGVWGPNAMSPQAFLSQLRITVGA